MKPRVTLFEDDCLTILRALPSQSVHLCITDPPYFLNGLGDGWNANTVRQSRSKAGVVGGLPVGMKFDPQQGRRFETFMHEVSKEVHRVLKPGGFYVSFSQARLYHRLGVAVENAGFELRDMLAWKYEGQAKAFSQDHFVRKMQTSDADKAQIIADLGRRKTPQLKPQFEPMTLAQKPREGTFVENWLNHRTRLVDVAQSLDGMFPGTIMDVTKPDRAEKGSFNDHPTVKPMRLIAHLMKLLSTEGQLILDPFIGSGTTAVAAAMTGRHCIGIERCREYIDISVARLSSVAEEAIVAVHADLGRLRRAA